MTNYNAIVYVLIILYFYIVNGEDCFVLANKGSARVTVVPAEPGMDR